MNTSLTNNEPKLLVDLDTGRVLRGDDSPVVSERWLRAHPFIDTADGGRTYFAGPDATRAALASKRGEPIGHLDAWQYESTRQVAGAVHLQRVEA